jgi:hypothetical protein
MLEKAQDPDCHQMGKRGKAKDGHGVEAEVGKETIQNGWQMVFLNRGYISLRLC